MKKKNLLLKLVWSKFLNIKNCITIIENPIEISTAENIKKKSDRERIKILLKYNEVIKVIKYNVIQNNSDNSKL